MADTATSTEPDWRKLGEAQRDPADNAVLPPTPSGTPAIGPPAWKRHGSLYFEDGNVVILAQGVLFRLHRGILALHSDVFRDLFTVPQPSHTDTLDGCPLICLQDSSFGLEWLFTSLYQGVKCPFFTPEKAISMRLVRQMLILGYKYNVEHVREEAIRRLKAVFPSDAEACNRWWSPQTGNSAIEMLPTEAVTVVNLARRFNLPFLLPAALYACCQLPMDRISQPINYSQTEFEVLHVTDFFLCLRAIPELLAHKCTVMSSYADFDVTRECPASARRCTASALRLTYAAMTSDVLTKPAPLEDVTTWYNKVRESWDATGRLCSVCADTMREAAKEIRDFVWKDLGRLFKVPSWNLDVMVDDDDNEN